MKILYTRRLLATLAILSLVTITQPRAEAAPEYIVNTAFTIAAGRFQVFPFHLRRISQIQGRFRATGGRNDVETYILDADGLENFQNGHQTATYYNSGRVTVATINVRLRPGQYFLVFSNTFSALTNKAVSAQVLAR